MIYLSFQYPRDGAAADLGHHRAAVLHHRVLEFFELAGSALNMFTARTWTRRSFGVDVDASIPVGQRVFIMIFAPVFAVMWVKLAKAGGAGGPGQVRHRPAAPRRRVPRPEPREGRRGGGDRCPPIFLILLYLLHTLGELALSPVGLSLVTKLAPAKIVGFMMGFWFLSSAIAHQAGKWIAGATAVDEKRPPEQKLDASLERVQQGAALFAIGSRCCSCCFRRSSRSGCTASSDGSVPRHAGIDDCDQRSIPPASDATFGKPACGKDRRAAAILRTPWWQYTTTRSSVGVHLGHARLQFAERDEYAARQRAEGVLLRLPHVERITPLPRVEERASRRSVESEGPFRCDLCPAGCQSPAMSGSPSFARYSRSFVAHTPFLLASRAFASSSS